MKSLMRISLLFIAAMAISSLTSGSAEAREIDTEKTVTTEQIQLGQALPKTLVIRVKAGTKETEVLHTRGVLKNDDSAKQILSTSSFIKLDAKGKMRGELDRDSSRSSWYFHYPNYSYGYYYYYGYQYAYVPYYNYYHAGYNYYYYGWPYYNPYCRY